MVFNIRFCVHMKHLKIIVIVSNNYSSSSITYRVGELRPKVPHFLRFRIKTFALSYYQFSANLIEILKNFVCLKITPFWGYKHS